MAQKGRPRREAMPYSLKVKFKNGITTEKKYPNRMSRNEEVARLKRERGDQILWLKIKDK
jgi:hypothetical protein